MVKYKVTMSLREPVIGDPTIVLVDEIRVAHGYNGEIPDGKTFLIINPDAFAYLKIERADG